jgi:hypothetical protein
VDPSTGARGCNACGGSVVTVLGDRFDSQSIRAWVANVSVSHIQVGFNSYDQQYFTCILPPMPLQLRGIGLPFVTESRNANSTVYPMGMGQVMYSTATVDCGPGYTPSGLSPGLVAVIVVLVVLFIVVLGMYLASKLGGVRFEGLQRCWASFVAGFKGEGRADDAQGGPINLSLLQGGRPLSDYLQPVQAAGNAGEGDGGYRPPNMRAPYVPSAAALHHQQQWPAAAGGAPGGADVQYGEHHRPPS